jgi:hypothetical protein
METDVRPILTVEGPVDTERWASTGFAVDDPKAVADCRRAARWTLERWNLGWVPDIIPDTVTMVSELVTNVQRHGCEAFDFGSFTLWHPNKWLILTVHDKAPMVPFGTINGSRTAQDPCWETGRGFHIVRSLAAEHLGEFDAVPDGDPVNPGKVLRVKMMLPDVVWGPAPRDPWRKP